jgi:hypothetical protein
VKQLALGVTREKSMKNREDDPNRVQPQPSNDQVDPAEPLKYELPIGLEDIVAVGILDSVLRPKRRRFKSRSTRRPK